MMKYLLFIASCLLLSCSQKEEANVAVVKTDSVVANQNGPSLVSEITCPKCHFKKKEIMPDDYCVLKYICSHCKSEIYPDDKDCCVFCTYGTYKCPSKQ